MSIASTENSVDRNVTRILRTVLANRGLSVSELLLKSGMTKSTYFRRQQHGGWTASEIAVLAQALNVPPSMFWEDPDDLFRLSRRDTTAGKRHSLPTAA